jgi:hypothetical protein
VKVIAQDAPFLAHARFFAFFGANVNTVLIALQSFAMIGVPLLLPLISEVRFGAWRCCPLSRFSFPQPIPYMIGPQHRSDIFFFFLPPHMCRCRTQ